MLKTVVAICLLFAFPAQRPARDARLPASTATDGIVYGTVFSSSAGVLPATTVVLASQELNRSWRALTNDAGGFRFESLPPGTYTLTAMHPQYLPAHYGQTFVGQEGRALRLAPGESTRADLVAVKGSAITGTVFDVYGNPAMDVQVQAYRLQNINGRRQLLFAFLLKLKFHCPACASSLLR